MTDIGAPPKRGEATPVPTDIETRKFQRPHEDRTDDHLIPKSYLEQRAEERRQRTPTYADLYAVATADASTEPVNNPLPTGQPLPAQPTMNPVAAQHPLAVQQPIAAQAMAYAPPGYIMPGAYMDFSPGAQMQGYGQPPYAANPYGGYPYGYARPMPGVPFVSPQEPWKPGQRAAALWGSFFQHTLFAIAVQVFLYGGLFLLLAATSWEGAEDVFENGMPSTLTDFMVWLAKPEHLMLSLVLLVLVVGSFSVGAYYSGALWQRAKGLQGRAKSFWLTSITGGSITFFTYLLFSPVIFIVWLFASLLIGQGGYAGMWSTTFFLIFLGGVVNGFICMGFGRLFLSRARPRIDFAKLAAEAEARARDADERALAGESDEAKYRIDGT